MRNEAWLENMLAELVLWDATVPTQDLFVKVMGDWAVATIVKCYFEEHGFEVELEPYGSYNKLIVKHTKNDNTG